MSRILWCILFFSMEIEGYIPNNSVIGKVRQRIENALEYIDKEYKKLNEDCFFGVTLSTAILMDIYKNGTNFMDLGSIDIINKSMSILQKYQQNVTPERMWVSKYMMDVNIWKKEINYGYNHIKMLSKIPSFNTLKKINKNQNNEIFLSNMDNCFKDIVDKTRFLLPKKCFIRKKCWDIYYKDDNNSSGYLLTHKLLLLQLARSRKCLTQKEAHEMKINQICSKIFSEVIAIDYYGKLDVLFDLFLEETLLCGYEGFVEFFSTKWLVYILKSQRSSGCFPAILLDERKPFKKRSTNIFKDGCADHTSGLGLAVLSLYYSIMIKETYIK